MKQFRLLLATLLAFVCTTGVWAQTTYTDYIDGIKYIIGSVGAGRVLVVGIDPNTDGIVRIPYNITFDGSEYKVVGFSPTVSNEELQTSKWKELYISCDFIDAYFLYNDLPRTQGLINLEKVVFYENSTFIPPVNSFSGCTGLAYVDLGKATLIRTGCFKDCYHLATVIANNVTTIEEHAFYDCNRLPSINLPFVKKIDNYAFYDCDALASVLWDASLVKEIGSYAFSGCPLTSLTFKNVDMIVGDYAFSQTAVTQIDCTSPTQGNYVIPMSTKPSMIVIDRKSR